MLTNGCIKDTRGQNIGNSQGKDFGGFKGYLEAVFGDPSLTTIRGKKWKKLKTNQGKHKAN